MTGDAASKRMPEASITPEYAISILFADVAASLPQPELPTVLFTRVAFQNEATEPALMSSKFQKSAPPAEVAMFSPK